MAPDGIASVKKEASVKTSSKSASAATTASTAPKTKSAFQLELEKHVAKKTSEDEE